MLICDLRKEDVKIGLKTYCKTFNVLDTIVSIEKTDWEESLIISIAWDNDVINTYDYRSFNSEVVDDCFLISRKKRR